MKKLILIISLLVLSACSTTPEIMLPPPKTEIKFDKSVYESCKPLAKLEDVKSFDEVLAHFISLIGEYEACKNKQDNSIKLLKKVANETE